MSYQDEQIAHYYVSVFDKLTSKDSYAKYAEKVGLALEMRDKGDFHTEVCLLLNVLDEII